MKEISMDLARIFCEDCDAGMKRVSKIVQAGAPFDRAQLDQLHQEFDTLLGGVRGIHALPEQEFYFRSMARYVRYLRNLQEAGHKVDLQDWKRLQSGIEMKWPCESAVVFNHNGGGHEQLVLLNSMVNRINGEK